MAEIPNMPLKTVFYAHFILIILSFIGTWGATASLFYNSTYIFVLFWCIIDANAAEPIQHAIYINCISFVADFLLLITRFPHHGGDFDVWLGVIFAVIHLIVRPITAVSLKVILQERNGSTAPFGGVSSMFGVGGTGQQRNYQDIDRPDPIPNSDNQGHPDFFRPQQL